VSVPVLVHQPAPDRSRSTGSATSWMRTTNGGTTKATAQAVIRPTTSRTARGERVAEPPAEKPPPDSIDGFAETVQHRADAGHAAGSGVLWADRAASAAGALLATLLGAGSGELVAAGGTGSALAVQSVKRSSGLGPVSWVLRAREQTVLWPSQSTCCSRAPRRKPAAALELSLLAGRSKEAA
jgi:hypothetical protein